MTKSLSASALILAAHGSHRNPAACAVVRAHADVIRDRNLFSQVETAFWHGEPALSNVLSTIVAEDAYVVPVFGSEGHFTKVILPREMALTGRTTCRANPAGPTQIHLCTPVGSHPRMPGLVHDLAVSTASKYRFEEKDTDVLVIGHGGKTSTGSEQGTLRVVEDLRARGNFNSISALFLEQPPRIDDWMNVIESKTVIAVPYLIGGGGHGSEIPGRLGLTAESTSGAVGDVHVAVSAAVGEVDDLAGLIVDQVVNYAADA